MIALLNALNPQRLWHSPDALMHAGTLALEGRVCAYACLGPRTVDGYDVAGLVSFLEAALVDPDPRPLLLLSCCPGFVADPSAEA